MSTPTPRTDAEAVQYTRDHGWVLYGNPGPDADCYVPIKVARQLETELAQARAEVADWYGAGLSIATRLCQQPGIKSEGIVGAVDELIARTHRAEAAAAQMRDTLQSAVDALSEIDTNALAAHGFHHTANAVSTIRTDATAALASTAGQGWVGPGEVQKLREAMLKSTQDCPQAIVDAVNRNFWELTGAQTVVEQLTKP